MNNYFVRPKLFNSIHKISGYNIAIITRYRSLIKTRKIKINSYSR